MNSLFTWTMPNGKFKFILFFSLYFTSQFLLVCVMCICFIVKNSQTLLCWWLANFLAYAPREKKTCHKHSSEELRPFYNLEVIVTIANHKKWYFWWQKKLFKLKFMQVKLIKQFQLTLHRSLQHCFHYPTSSY